MAIFALDVRYYWFHSTWTIWWSTTKKRQQLQTHREISDKHFLIINWKLLWSTIFFNLITKTGTIWRIDHSQIKKMVNNYSKNDLQVPWYLSIKKIFLVMKTIVYTAVMPYFLEVVHAIIRSRIELNSFCAKYYQKKKKKKKKKNMVLCFFF